MKEKTFDIDLGRGANRKQFLGIVEKKRIYNVAI
jgi:hypothetical protein